MIFDRLNSDKKRFDLLRGGYCVGDTGPGFLCSGEKWAENIAQIVFVLIEWTQPYDEFSSWGFSVVDGRSLVAGARKNAEIFWIFLRKSLKNNWPKWLSVILYTTMQQAETIRFSPSAVRGCWSQWYENNIARFFARRIILCCQRVDVTRLFIGKNWWRW